VGGIQFRPDPLDHGGQTFNLEESTACSCLRFV
jgi:hypothetical protein